MTKFIGAVKILVVCLTVTQVVASCSDNMPSADPQETTASALPSSQSDKPKLEEELTFLEGSLKSKLESIGIPYPDSQWAAFIKQGEGYLQSEQSDAALDEFQKALGQISYVKNDDPRRIKTLTDLAITYLTLEKYAEAQKQFKELLSIYDKRGEKGEQVAITCSELGRTSANLSCYSEAREYYTRALSIYSKLPDPQHSKVKWVLHELAVTDQYDGKYNLAEPIYKRLIAMHEADASQLKTDDQKEENQWLLAVAMHRLADIYVDQKRFADAEPLLNKVIDIYGKQLPESAAADSDLDACIMLTDVADYQIQSQQWAQAQKTVERLIATEQRLVPPDNDMLRKNADRLAVIRAKLTASRSQS